MAKKEMHTAIVTRNTDKDLGLKLRGAVYFEAPSLFEGEFPIPAIPCFPFASAEGAGMFWVPQVGDEIEVEIMADDGTDDTIDVDIPEPRYTCMVYSDVADIDEIFKTNYTKRMGWKTNSGHYLLFDDTKDKQFLSLVTGKGHQFIMSDEKDLEQIFFKTTKGHQLLFDDKEEQVKIATVGNHKILLDDKNGVVEIQHTAGGKLKISDDKVELIDNSGNESVILEGGKVTAQSSGEFIADAPIAKIGSSPSFHATLSENMISLHDEHQHPPIPPLVGGPVLPPLVPISAKAGTPLDPTALSVYLKGNT